MGKESLRLRTTSAPWEMVVLKRSDKGVQVDIVATAGGSGIFNISWGSELRFVKSMRKKLILFCEDNDIRYQYLTVGL